MRSYAISLRVKNRLKFKEECRKLNLDYKNFLTVEECKTFKE